MAARKSPSSSTRKPASAPKKSTSATRKPAAPASAAPPQAATPPKPSPQAAVDVAKQPDKKDGKDQIVTSKKKMVRDSFTMPAPDYALISVLKSRTLSSGTAVKKSELLRAGLVALAAMPAAQLIGLVASMPLVKTGRPGKKKK